MKLDLTIYHFEELIKKGYSLDQIYLLLLIHENIDIKELCNDSIKIKTIYTSLLRKGVITEEEKLTTLGLDLLEFISKKTNKKFIKKKAEKSDFDDWWAIYPSTDEFVLGTKKFTGTRGLRINKDKCRLQFNKIIDEGVYTKEDIINATLYDVNQRKRNSLKQNKNNLTFLQGSEVYLNQKSFEPFVALSKKSDTLITPTIIGSTDI